MMQFKERERGRERERERERGGLKRQNKEKDVCGMKGKGKDRVPMQRGENVCRVPLRKKATSSPLRPEKIYLTSSPPLSSVGGSIVHAGKQ